MFYDDDDYDEIWDADGNVIEPNGPKFEIDYDCDDDDSTHGSMPGLFVRNRDVDDSSDESSESIFLTPGKPIPAWEYELDEFSCFEIGSFVSETDSNLDDGEEKLWHDDIQMVSEVENVKSELVLKSSDKPAFPDDQKLLNHPNFWIADTAASVHMTPYKQGMRNVHKRDIQLSLGDKTSVISGKVGDLSNGSRERNSEIGAMRR